MNSIFSRFFTAALLASVALPAAAQVRLDVPVSRLSPTVLGGEMRLADVPLQGLPVTGARFELVTPAGGSAGGVRVLLDEREMGQIDLPLSTFARGLDVPVALRRELSLRLTPPRGPSCAGGLETIATMDRQASRLSLAIDPKGRMTLPAIPALLGPLLPADEPLQIWTREGHLTANSIHL